MTRKIRNFFGRKEQKPAHEATRASASTKPQPGEDPEAYTRRVLSMTIDQANANPNGVMETLVRSALESGFVDRGFAPAPGETLVAFLVRITPDATQLMIEAMLSQFLPFKTLQEIRLIPTGQAVKPAPVAVAHKPAPVEIPLMEGVTRWKN
jgi:hypothetical protein